MGERLYTDPYSAWSPSLRALIEPFGQRERPDEDGNTPLYNALCRPELTKLLLDHGAAADVANWDDIAPLFLCSRSIRAGPSVRLLLGSGADVNIQGPMAETPLCSAIKNRRTQMIEILLAEGADPELADAYGRDCYDWVSSTSADWLTLQSQDRLVRRYPAREPALAAAIQDSSIALTIRKIRTVTAMGNSKPKQYRRSLWYSRLGQLLLLRRNFDDARTAFERFMTNTVKEAEAMSFYVSCDSREANYVLGDRFVCCTCTNIDLCVPCMDEYRNNEIVEMDAFEVCKGHEFLKVPRPGWAELEAGKVNERGEREEGWLERLGKEYRVESLA